MTVYSDIVEHPLFPPPHSRQKKKENDMHTCHTKRPTVFELLRQANKAQGTIKSAEVKTLVLKIYTLESSVFP